MLDRDNNDLHITSIPVMWTIESLDIAHKEATGEYKETLATMLNQAVMNELKKAKFDVGLIVEAFTSFEGKIAELWFLLNHTQEGSTTRQAVINKIDAFLLPKIAELSDEDSIELLIRLAPSKSKSDKAIQKISSTRCDKYHAELNKKKKT